MTIAAAAAEAGVGIKVMLIWIVAGTYRAYGRHRGLGLFKVIPRHEFAELPISRLPPEMRYATESELMKLREEQSALESGHATDAQRAEWWKGKFAHLSDGVVAPDYVEQELDRFYAFYLAPRLRDTWFDVERDIIYADDKREWTDVRVERVADAATPPSKPKKHRYPGDAALVERGRKMIADEGFTKSEVARRLALEAKGGDFDRCVERLRKRF
jgi:hypothetical protein